MRKKIFYFISIILITSSFLIMFWPTSHAREELLLAEEVSGGEFCSSKTPKSFDAAVKEVVKKKDSPPYLEDPRAVSPEVTYREEVIKVFDNIKYPCLALQDWDKQLYTSRDRTYKLYKNSGYITVNNFRMSLIYTRLDKISTDRKSGVELIFVRVPGGPGGSNIISNFDEVINYDSGTLTLDFFYRGHGFNLNYPGTSFDIAVKDLKIFLKNLRSRNKSSKIILVGESLGGSLSAAVLSELSSEKSVIVDKAILFSPPFASLQESANKLEKLSHNLSKNDRYSLYRLRDEGKNGNDYGSVKYLDWLDVFRTFYTAEDGRLELYDWLKLAPQTPVLIVYGSRDDRISIEKSSRFTTKNLDNVEIFTVDGMNHQFNRFLEAADIKAEVDAFLH